MGDRTEENPLTREDVLRLIEENGGTAEGLDLSDKKFEKGIDLRELNLCGIILDKVQIQGNLKIAPSGTGAHLEEAYLAETHFERARLFDVHLEGANLGSAHLEGADLWSAHLEGAYLSDTHLEGAYLWNAKFSPDTELENADWGNYIVGEEKDGYFDSAADIYRRLKQWHTNAGMYDIAGKFFFREMTVKRKMLEWWPNPVPRAWSKFLSLICGYGERPLRVIGWAASVVVGLALIYFIIGLTWEWSAFWQSLYFSAVSFTALGYGSWVNTTNDWIRAIGAFESFIGVFTIALFLITFIRKMAR